MFGHFKMIEKKQTKLMYKQNAFTVQRGHIKCTV